MRRRDSGETDAIVRRILGYSRVFRDPVHDPADTRVRMNTLMVTDFADLNARLTAGEPLPEVWDRAQLFRARARAVGGGWRFVYPPGKIIADSCPSCDWIDRAARETACRRCHTIRMRE